MRKVLATMVTFLAPITLLLFNSCEVTTPTDPDDNGNANPNDTVTVVTKTDGQIDSLIKVLIFRAEQLDDVESSDDIKSIEFKALANVFAGIVKGDSDNYKANVGLIVSSVLALNSNSTLQNLADSLDSYFSDMDDFWGEDEEVILKIAQLNEKLVRPYQKLYRKIWHPLFLEEKELESSTLKQPKEMGLTDLDLRSLQQCQR